MPVQVETRIPERGEPAARAPGPRGWLSASEQRTCDVASRDAEVEGALRPGLGVGLGVDASCAA